MWRKCLLPQLFLGLWIAFFREQAEYCISLLKSPFGTRYKKPCLRPARPLRLAASSAVQLLRIMNHKPMLALQGRALHPRRLHRTAADAAVVDQQFPLSPSSMPQSSPFIDHTKWHPSLWQCTWCTAAPEVGALSDDLWLRVAGCCARLDAPAPWLARWRSCRCCASSSVDSSASAAACAGW